MDVVTLGAALRGAKMYTDATIAPLLGGVHYRGSVNYASNLPADPSEGDAYTVKYKGTTGTEPDGTEYVWGLDTDDNTYKWIGFSPDTYTKSEVDALLSGKQAVIDSDHKLDSELIDDDGNISALVHCYRAYYRTQQNTLTILDNREAEFLADMAADRSGNPRTIMLDLSVDGDSKGILRNMGNGFYGERHSAMNNGFDTIIALNIEMTLDPPSIYYMAYNEKPYSFTRMTDYTKPQSTSAITDTDTVSSAIGKLEKGLDGKQATLTVGTNLDAVPTENSNNPVTSDGVADALAGKQPTIDSNHKVSANLVQEENDKKFAYKDANGNIFIGGTQITQIIDSDSYDALVTKQNLFYLIYPTPANNGGE